MFKRPSSAIKPAVLALALAAPSANAGFFDFLKSSDDKAAPEASQTQSAPAPAAQPAVKEEGLAGNLDLAKSLIPMLSDKLSISDDQATGGLGSIMEYAKSALSDEEGESLSQGIPGLDTLIAAAPLLTGGNSGSKGGLSSALGQIGGLGGSLGEAASAIGGLDKLTQQFEALGLSPEMIGQIAQLAVEFFSSSDEDTGNLLEKALGSLLK